MRRRLDADVVIAGGGPAGAGAALRLAQYGHEVLFLDQGRREAPARRREPSLEHSRRSRDARDRAAAGARRQATPVASRLLGRDARGTKLGRSSGARELSSRVARAVRPLPPGAGGVGRSAPSVRRRLPGEPLRRRGRDPNRGGRRFSGPASSSTPPDAPASSPDSIGGRSAASARSRSPDTSAPRKLPLRRSSKLSSTAGSGRLPSRTVSGTSP